jgi:hypothetical protein
LIVTSTDGCRSRGCRRGPRSPTRGRSSPSRAGPKTSRARKLLKPLVWRLDVDGAHLIPSAPNRYTGSKQLARSEGGS